MPFVRCHGAGRIHYAERGEPRADSLPVLLIHGAGGSAAVWMMVMARLARLTRVVAIDLPGHGPSDPGPDQPAAVLGGYRDACGELAALLGLGRSVLVGHSMGALVAIKAALAWPDKVAGLVLCGAAPRLPVNPELLAVLEEDFAGFPSWLAARAFSPAAKPALRRGFVAAGVVASQTVTQRDFAATAAADLGSQVGAIACPTIWLDGADDQLVFPGGAPGETRRLESVGHLVPIEAPAEVARAAAALARRAPAPSS